MTFTLAVSFRAGAPLARELVSEPVPCQNSHNCSELVFLCLSGCSPVLADQAVDDLSARDPGGHIDRLAGLVQRRSLFPRLVRPVLVVVPRVLGQDPPEVPFAVRSAGGRGIRGVAFPHKAPQRKLPGASGPAS